MVIFPYTLCIVVGLSKPDVLNKFPHMRWDLTTAREETLRSTDVLGER
jgi:hypothetical protein